MFGVLIASDRWVAGLHRVLPAASALVATLVLEAPAQASCSAPEPGVIWTYPDAATLAVPADAVFWAVSLEGVVTVEVDGVPLTPLGTGVVDRHQFASTAPLSEGEHELVARVELAESEADRGESDERRVRFDVTSEAATTADLSVSSVRAYPLRYGDETIVNPPASEYDLCSEPAIALHGRCDDIIPSRLLRVEYQPQGTPIAYLVQGDTLVPAGCPWFWFGDSSGVSSSLAYVAQAVLPTGVGPSRAFSGAVEVRGLRATAVADAPTASSSSAGCALASGRSARSDAAVVALAVLAGALRWRRRPRC
jgi:hypothetical protein